jgi:hypothetical protein
MADEQIKHVYCGELTSRSTLFEMGSTAQEYKQCMAPNLIGLEASVIKLKGISAS